MLYVINYKKVIKNNKNGFTLLELVVSIGIIVAITTVFLVNYNGASKSSALQLEAHKLAGDIRRAQNMALGSKEFNGSMPAGGWGVYILDSGSYIIFADNDNDKIYDGTGDCDNECYEKISLANNITFSSTGDRITFLPPEPLTYINGVNSGSVAITLIDADAANTKSILINFLGLIDVE